LAANNRLAIIHNVFCAFFIFANMKHYNIPIFLPELACPFRCVYCNQFSIAGSTGIPDPLAVKEIIERNLASFPEVEREVEVAFFGGNFTGLPLEMQDQYLNIVQPYLNNGSVNSIRCSTRPDYISNSRLSALKRAGIKHIELGAQSTNDHVLNASGRGHLSSDIEKASQMIIEHGFTLGLQMMLGLPQSSPELDMQTATDIVRLGAEETRIYPCLVIGDTQLEKSYRNGKYSPLSLDAAVNQAADVYLYFITKGVKVLRVGLHPSDELDNGAFVAGPYHHNFAEMVYAEIWRRKFSVISSSGERLEIRTHSTQRTQAIGYHSANKHRLLQSFRKVDFVAEDSLNPFEFRYSVIPYAQPQKKIAIASTLMPVPAKQSLLKLAPTLWLTPTDFCYPSISAHPDIYFFAFDDKLVFAPNTPRKWIEELGKNGVKLIKGNSALGREHPETTFYNASGTSDVLVHRLQYTDARILNLYKDKLKIDVPQAYTRCNLLALNQKSFITSDKGIMKKLSELGFDVLFIDPKPIVLDGHEYGFFPGCCGLLNQTLVVCGSTCILPEKELLDSFLQRNGFSLFELYDGPLVDLGGIFFVNSSRY
jgi:Histone acetyltransferase